MRTPHYATLIERMVDKFGSRNFSEIELAIEREINLGRSIDVSLVFVTKVVIRHRTCNLDNSQVKI